MPKMCHLNTTKTWFLERRCQAKTKTSHKPFLEQKAPQIFCKQAQ